VWVSCFSVAAAELEFDMSSRFVDPIVRGRDLHPKEIQPCCERGEVRTEL